MVAERLDEDEKNTVSLADGIPGNPNKTIVNESGLYSTILRSEKPEAKVFRKWITSEVLPAMRLLLPEHEAIRDDSGNVAGVEHGETTYMTEAEVTEIKLWIEHSGRTDLANVRRA